MSEHKPRKGQEVRYTKTGLYWHKVSTGTERENDIFGEVVCFGESNLVYVKTQSGDIDCFIWIFADGLNTNFEWGENNGMV